MSLSRRKSLILLTVFLAILSCSIFMPDKPVSISTSAPVQEASPQVILIDTEQPSTMPMTATQRASTPSSTVSPLGTLVVEFVYTGEWYRETFNYQPTAPNIRHMVLVIPEESEVILSSPGWVFSTLTFTPYPESFVFRPEATEYMPLLKYLHDAYAGLAEVVLEPGRYKVAVAFIAAALPPPDDDAILYPGVTGGGASNEFHSVEVRAGEITHVIYELTDENGWGALNILAMR